jgi:hypothetical protein
VVGILFIVSPRIPGNDGVHFQQADEEDQSPDELVEGDVAHAVVVVVEIEVALAAEDSGDFGVVAFIAKDVLADGACGAESRGVAHVVVGAADEVAGVALFDELGDGTCRKERDVVRVGLAGQQHFSFVRLAGGRLLEKHAWLRLLGGGEPGDRAGCQDVAEEIAPKHALAIILSAGA